jgi:hypothetical protein
MKARGHELLPTKGYKLNSHSRCSSGRSSSTSLREAVQAARGVLLGPVVGDLSYDMEITWRYQQAAEIVNCWPRLTHFERIALNSSLPWEETVHLVWEAKRPRAGSQRAVV